MNLRCALPFMLVSCLWIPSAWSVPAAPIEIELRQPDGSTFIAVTRGDEYSSWTETLSGHTIIKQGNTWFYAELDDAGELVATDLVVGSIGAAVLEVLPRHIAPERTVERFDRGPIRQLRTQSRSDARATESPRTLTHTQPVLTILVDYSDISFTYTDASFESLMYGGSDSVKEFFLENSYSGFSITPASETYDVANDGVVHVSRAVNHPNLGQADWRSEASAVLALADASVDFSTYDTNMDNDLTPDELSVVIILAGYETSFGGAGIALTPNVWGHVAGFGSSEPTLDGVDVQAFAMFGEAHATSNKNKHQATIGVMCHELGHLMFDLPDLYDVDESSNGIGDWGLMGSGSWNFVGAHSGDSPAHLNAFSKVATGITIPQDIDVAQASVSFPDAEANELAKRIWIDRYKVRTGQYFLVENRQATGFDSGLPGDGLLIWHIDGAQRSNNDETRKWVDLEEADGSADLDDATSGNDGDDGDPYPGTSSNTTFDDNSVPDSKDYDGTATMIGVTNISASSSTMTADITPRPGGFGDHVRYDDERYETSYGPFTSLYLGVRMQNDTAFDMLDGIDVYVVEPAGATIDIFFYSSMAGGTPSGLLYSETGLAGAQGWNRFLFATPQSFPIGTERGVVVKVTYAVAGFLIPLNASGPLSGRSYIDLDGVGTFDSLCGPAPSAPFCGDLNIVGLFNDAVPVPPMATAITPETTGPTNASSIEFTVQFDKDVVNFNDAADVVISHTGTAHTGVSISGADDTYTATVTGISGNGSFTLAADTGSDIEDTEGIPLGGSVSSAAVTIDNLAPTVQIGEPSTASTTNGPVTYEITYTGADSVSLADIDVTLNKTGTADGTVGVSGARTSIRTVTVSGITGTGTLGISIAAGTASDQAGNTASAAGPSSTFSVVPPSAELDFGDGFEPR